MPDFVTPVEAIGRGWTAHPYSFGDGQRALARGFAFLASALVAPGHLYHGDGTSRIIVVHPDTLRQALGEPRVDVAALPVSLEDLKKPGAVFGPRYVLDDYARLIGPPRVLGDFRRLIEREVGPDHVVTQPPCESK